MNKKQRKELEKIVHYQICKHTRQRKASKVGTPRTTEYFYYRGKDPTLIPVRNHVVRIHRELVVFTVESLKK